MWQVHTGHDPRAHPLLSLLLFIYLFKSNKRINFLCTKLMCLSDWWPKKVCERRGEADKRVNWIVGKMQILYGLFELRGGVSTHWGGLLFRHSNSLKHAHGGLTLTKNSTKKINDGAVSICASLCPFPSSFSFFAHHAISGWQNLLSACMAGPHHRIQSADGIHGKTKWRKKHWDFSFCYAWFVCFPQGQSCRSPVLFPVEAAHPQKECVSTCPSFVHSEAGCMCLLWMCGLSDPFHKTVLLFDLCDGVCVLSNPQMRCATVDSLFFLSYLTNTVNVILLWLFYAIMCMCPA